MKLNTLTSIVHPFRSRTSLALMLSGFAVAAQVACSDAPTQGGFPTNTAGTPAMMNTGGTPVSTAGTPATTAGTFSNSSGSGGTFATAGTDAGAGTFSVGGSTGGTATAGTDAGGTTSTAGTATAGTGGDPPAPVAYCSTHTLEALPYDISKGFKSSGYGPDATSILQIQQDGNVTTPPTNYCMTARATGAVGDCSMWRFTPATVPTYAYVAWSRNWDAHTMKDPVCLADGAKAVIFYARGVKGGEKIIVAGSGQMTDTEVTLTAAWKQYSFSIDGISYNDFTTGLPPAFSWKIVPAAGDAVTEFFIDNIMVVKDIPTGP